MPHFVQVCRSEWYRSLSISTTRKSSRTKSTMPTLDLHLRFDPVASSPKQDPRHNFDLNDHGGDMISRRVRQRIDPFANPEQVAGAKCRPQLCAGRSPTEEIARAGNRTRATKHLK